MKSFLDLVKARHSVRAYLDRPVEVEKIDAILEAARLAPSAVNFQPWHFHVVESAEAREALCAAYNRDWFRTAPLYIVVSVDDSTAWTRQSDGHGHGDVDAAIAGEHICLAAADLGLASCWVCNFDMAVASSALGLEAPLRPVAIFPIGYAAAEPKPTTRKPLADLVTRI